MVNIHDPSDEYAKAVFVIEYGTRIRIVVSPLFNT